ncbi:DUF7919 family protein [Streptomyces rimosus]|uniref:DUF7919 family protein n=1 Tax=Streptomyces rimosus TaxID=1927 RepID=UPI000A6C6459|nr:hypothetical protein [Streptomyces rimosus]
MAEYKDLTEYRYLDSPIPMLNIGWLGTELGTQGVQTPPPQSLLLALEKEVNVPRSLTLGSHECEFCPSEGHAPETGNGEIHIYAPSGRTYSAPTLVLHYVKAHQYTPPAEFTAASTAPGAPDWDDRAEMLCSALKDESGDPAWQVNALIDLPNWHDSRAYQAIAEAATNEEISLTADYELARSLSRFWTRSRSIDVSVYEKLPPNVRAHLDVGKIQRHLQT